jgi:hypothetical protein
MGDDVPPVVEQRPRDLPSDALAGAGHDRGASFAHGTVIASLQR